MLGVVEPIFAQYPTSPSPTSAFASARVPSSPTAHSCKSSEALTYRASTAPSAALQELSSALLSSEIPFATLSGYPGVAERHPTCASNISCFICREPAFVAIYTFAHSSSMDHSHHHHHQGSRILSK